MCRVNFGDGGVYMRASNALTFEFVNNGLRARVLRTSFSIPLK